VGRVRPRPAACADHRRHRRESRAARSRRDAGRGGPCGFLWRPAHRADLRRTVRARPGGTAMREREPVAGMVEFGALGAVLCGLALWLEWSPVVWWIGAAIVLLALVVIAWRRGIKRRPLWVAGAAVVGLAVAAVPVVEPVVRPSAEVAWSIEGSEEPVAEAA